MKKYISFVCLLLLLFACNNKEEEKSLITPDGEKQYVEITGQSDKKLLLLFIHRSGMAAGSAATLF